MIKILNMDEKNPEYCETHSLIVKSSLQSQLKPQSDLKTEEVDGASQNEKNLDNLDEDIAEVHTWLESIEKIEQEIEGRLELIKRNKKIIGEQPV